MTPGERCYEAWRREHEAYRAEVVPLHEPWNRPLVPWAKLPPRARQIWDRVALAAVAADTVAPSPAKR